MPSNWETRENFHSFYYYNHIITKIKKFPNKFENFLINIFKLVFKELKAKLSKKNKLIVGTI
ncbi:hypothetical protein DR088_00010 [Mycoplasma hyopneumoniae]|nr:hypothetical protein [Mesomycoplasma hyopneumoniae]MXR63831.1 hypothetical protein [Mesomycoplasma hyopneumoniae]